MPRWFTRNESWDFGGKPDPAEDQQGEQRHHDEGRDHGENNAVLGHRLTLLDAEACTEVSD